MNSGYILFSEGEYSDYQNRAFAVLKPFKLEDVTIQFLAQWVPTYNWEKKPYSGDFIAWMNKQGFIRDADEVPEIHLGGYEFEPEKIGLDLMRHEFTPPSP
jgi:hypothetical protein